MIDDRKKNEKARILVVEDEAIVSEDLEFSLQNLGYAVIANVPTGLEAVELARELEPDLIIMDVKLRGQVDGIQAAHKIRAQMDIPVVYLTAYWEKDVLDRAKLTEPYGYVNKPFSLQELTNTIETAIYKHRADRLVRASEERLRLAMEAANEGIWDWNVETGETYYSPAYFLILGLEPGECPEHFTSWLDLIHPDDREHAWKINQDCIMGKIEAFETEFRMKHKDGSWRWILGRGKSIARNSEGKSVRLVGTHTDVNERKKVEEALREKEARFRACFELPLIGIAVSSPEKEWLEVNDKFCEILGYSREELMKLTWVELTHPDDLEADFKNFERALRGETEGFSIEKRYLPQSGKKAATVVHAEISARCLRNADGSVKYFVTLIRDITEMKEAERALRESEAKFRAIFEQSPIGISVVEFDHRLLEVNDSFCKIFGYSGQELSNLTIADLSHPDDLAKELPLIEKLLRNEIPSYVCKKRVFRKNGETAWINVTGTTIKNAQGLPVFGIGMVHDITDKKSAEEALIQWEQRFRNLYKKCGEQDDG
jgi:PAS domain S-box-containing protein